MFCFLFRAPRPGNHRSVSSGSASETRLRQWPMKCRAFAARFSTSICRSPVRNRDPPLPRVVTRHHRSRPLHFLLGRLQSRSRDRHFRSALRLLVTHDPPTTSRDPSSASRDPPKFGHDPSTKRRDPPSDVKIFAKWPVPSGGSIFETGGSSFRSGGSSLATWGSTFWTGGSRFRSRGSTARSWRSTSGSRRRLQRRRGRNGR